MIELRAGDLQDPRIIALLELHHRKCREVTPPGSSHVLDPASLNSSTIDFRAAWDAGSLVGVGAVKMLDPAHGEVKSMHTIEAARGRGVGSALLTHLMDRARARGLRRLSLETGSFGYFLAAVRLYKAHGFVECEPFGQYAPDPNSVFLTRTL